MTFLVLLIAVLLQWYSNWARMLHNYDIWQYYWQGLQQVLGKMPLWRGYGNLVFALVPVLLFVSIIEFFLLSYYYDVLEFLFGLLVLLYCMQAYDIRFELNKLLEAQKQGDWHEAAAQASHFSHKAVSAEPKAVAEVISKQLFTIAETRVFGVFFWFFILGPVGAVLYYLTLRLCEFAPQKDDEAPYKEMQQCAQQLQKVLDWIPLRLLAISYAMVGNFVSALPALRQLMPANLQQSFDEYLQVGLNALQFEMRAEEQSAEITRDGIALIERSVILWLVIIGLITVI